VVKKPTSASRPEVDAERIGLTGGSFDQASSRFKQVFLYMAGPGEFDPFSLVEYA
jgi:hypothetical protein